MYWYGPGLLCSSHVVQNALKSCFVIQNNQAMEEVYKVCDIIPGSCYYILMLKYNLQYGFALPAQCKYRETRVLCMHNTRVMMHYMGRAIYDSMSSEHSSSIVHAFEDHCNHFQTSSHVVQAQKQQFPVHTMTQWYLLQVWLHYVGRANSDTT